MDKYICPDDVRLFAKMMRLASTVGTSRIKVVALPTLATAHANLDGDPAAYMVTIYQEERYNVGDRIVWDCETNHDYPDGVIGQECGTVTDHCEEGYIVDQNDGSGQMVICDSWINVEATAEEQGRF